MRPGTLPNNEGNEVRTMVGLPMVGIVDIKATQIMYFIFTRTHKWCY